MIWEIGQQVGVRPASIHDLYMARGRGETGGYTVPAINVRGVAYDTARAIFRTAIRTKAGAFLLEIARSEIAYTDQRPAEYVTVMLAAALREGFRGPVFVQGDHFQVNAKKYEADPEGEVAAVKQLAREAIEAGFFNIDIDTSTLVDLSHEQLDEQQRLNYEVGADLTRFVRELEPEGVTISIGGEIGEVGTENSTVPELRAYMDGYNRTLEKLAPGTAGLSKISVQSGTSHGGVVLADGSIAEVALDLKTLEDLSRVARDEYGLAGAVQHGASTLPDARVQQLPAHRDGRDPSRDELPEHALRSSARGDAGRDLRVAARQRRRGAEGRRTPTSSSSTRRGRRRSARSSARSGTCPRRHATRSVAPTTRSSGSSSTSWPSAGPRTRWRRSSRRRRSGVRCRSPIGRPWRPRPTIRTPGNRARVSAGTTQQPPPAGDSASAVDARRWLDRLYELARPAGHELRNSLNGVAVNLEVVRSRAARPGGTTESVVRFAEAAVEQLDTLTHLTEILLRLMRPAAEPAAVGAMTEQVGALLAAVARSEGGSVSVGTGGDGAPGTTSLPAERARAVVAALLLAAFDRGAALSCDVASGPPVELRLRREPALDAPPDDLRALADACDVELQHGSDAWTARFPTSTD